MASTREMSKIPPDADPEGNASSSGEIEPRPAEAKVGYFHVYKYGQGYWTRLGTAFGAALIALFIAYFVFEQVPVLLKAPTLTTDAAGELPARSWLESILFSYDNSGTPNAVLTGRVSRMVQLGIAGLVFTLIMAIVWGIMNSPKPAQFLIDTDNELKKVNWATRAELMGSTRVVIAFMLLTATSLFVFDTLYHQFFYAIRIWLIPPDGYAVVVSGFVFFTVLLVIGATILRGARDERGRRTDESRGVKLGVVITGIAVLGLAAWVAGTLLGWFGTTPLITPVTPA